MKICKLIIISFFLISILNLLTPKVSFTEDNPCLSCHVDLKQPAKSVHAALGLGCQACHKTVQGKNHPDQKGSIILTQEMPGLCYTCHDESKFKGKSIHSAVSLGMCTGCHNAHKSNFPKLLLKDAPGLCYNCHDESKFRGKSGHTLVGMCMGCHNPHSSNSNKLLKSDEPELCYTCHDKSQFAKKYVHSIIPTGGCTSCHTPHASNSPFLLVKNSVNETCITCHLNKADGSHIVSVPGRRTHPIKGIDPSSQKLIKIPHPTVPGAEVEVPDPDAPGKEMTCVTCHNPHSSDFPKLFPVENICLKCHKYF